MPRLPATLALAALALTACQSADASGDETAIKATDKTCEVAKTTFPAGAHTFVVVNAGSKVTEVYVYGTGDHIVSERENIGPGITVKLTVDLAAGTYEIACKPGQRGDGIRQTLTVTPGSTDRATTDPRLTTAVAAYRTYVAQQVAQTLATTRAFAAAVKAGDVANAKALYAPSRKGWEAIEPVAESFGDIDPKVDLREADLESGQTWSGWHRIEKALWRQQSTQGMEAYADTLLRDLADLQRRIPTAEITPASMANGAKELLDEVATGKVTGEEEAFSHTDLSDVAANVDGAHKVLALLAPVARSRDPALVTTLDKAFARLDEVLATHRRGAGFVSYDKVPTVARKQLSDAVNALSEPLSRLAAAVITP